MAVADGDREMVEAGIAQGAKLIAQRRRRPGEARGRWRDAHALLGLGGIGILAFLLAAAAMPETRPAT